MFAKLSGFVGRLVAPPGSEKRTKLHPATIDLMKDEVVRLRVVRKRASFEIERLSASLDAARKQYDEVGSQITDLSRTLKDNGYETGY